MTILVVDVSTVTTESRAEDQFRFRAPQVRSSVLTPGVVSTEWATVPTPDGPVEVLVEPGPLEVQLLSKRPGPKFLVDVPNVERVRLRDLLDIPKDISPGETAKIWQEIVQLKESVASSSGLPSRTYGSGPPPDFIPGAGPGHEYVDVDTMTLYVDQ